MNSTTEPIFHDIPISENSKQLFEKLLSTKEERSVIVEHLLNFYNKSHNINTSSKDYILNKSQFINALHLLVISFAYIIVIKDEDSFNQFYRRFLYESKNDSPQIFLLKQFFLSNFDSSEESNISAITSHQEIKKRTDDLLSRYIQFFRHYF